MEKNENTRRKSYKEVRDHLQKYLSLEMDEQEYFRYDGHNLVSLPEISLESF